MTKHRPHLYLPGGWEDGSIPLDQAARHHLATVLRLRGGDSVTYTDGRGTVGLGTLDGEAVTRGNEATLERPQPSLTMAVAPPKATERSRMVVEKLAEMGVDRLQWLDTVHVEGRVPKIPKRDAWRSNALEQSQGAWLLDVASPVSLDDLAQDAVLWVATPGGEPPQPVSRPLVVAVGPEGGFAEDEIPPNAQRIGLGDRILRVETAVVVSAALALYHLGRSTTRSSGLDAVLGAAS